MKILILCLTTLLISCTSQPQIDPARIKTGEAVQAPHGYVDLCKREPSPACGDKK